MENIDWLLRVVAALVCACFFVVGTIKLLGVAQQSGYKTCGIVRWLFQKSNTLLVRLLSWTLAVAFACAITNLCFSFASADVALCLSALPFLGFSLLYCLSDRKFALKVPTKFTGRVKRLFVVYFFLTAIFTWLIVFFSAYIYDLADAKLDSKLYELWQYLPVALMPLLLPVLFLVANFITYPLESLHNAIFVKRAQAKLAKKNCVKIAVVGSYGKTSVKNILSTILSQKYAVCATPSSFNTPMGIAKTTKGEDFEKAEIFIAEMGARKKGDISTLCKMVKPEYALFTGVCAQHIATFGSLEKIKREKSNIFACGARKIVCASSLKEELSENVNALTEEEKQAISFLTGEEIQALEVSFDRTKCDIVIGEENYRMDAPLLGKHSAENVALCVALAKEMGLTKEEIEKGLSALQPIPHRLQLLQENGVYILDDAYNANERGAVEAIDALCRFEGRKFLVTPGLVETGVLQQQLSEALGEKIAAAGLDEVILIGHTQIAPAKKAYLAAGGDKEKIFECQTLEQAKEMLAGKLHAGDAVLFLNDLPDVY